MIYEVNTTIVNYPLSIVHSILYIISQTEELNYV